MAQSSRKLGIVSLVIALTIISLSDLYGADWKLLAEDSACSIYYDEDSLERPFGDDIARVWVLFYPSEEMIPLIEAQLGKKYRALGYAFELVDIRCGRGTFRLRSLQCYSSDGTYLGSVLRNSDFPTLWQRADPLNVLRSGLLEGLCK